MISEVKRKVITSCSSVCKLWDWKRKRSLFEFQSFQKGLKQTLTSAPMTPNDVKRKYSNGRVFEVVCKNGYRNRGICACKNTVRVSGCEATHCRRANALQTRFDWWAVNVAGLIEGYILIISWRRAAIVPKLCHSIGARSVTVSRFLLNSSRAASRVSGWANSLIHWNTWKKCKEEYE